jgi:hypothetical protein
MTKPDKTATLIDQLYWISFTGNPRLRNMIELRRKLITARRFVLDDSMSAFLADLAIAAFRRRWRGLVDCFANEAGHHEGYARAQPRAGSFLVWSSFEGCFTGWEG